MKIEESQKLELFVNRGDGLGERLRAIFSGLCVAEYLDLEFRFCWSADKFANEFHAIEAVEEVFDQSFMDRYYLAEAPKNINAYIRLSKKNKISKSFARSQLYDKKLKGFYSTEVDLSRVIKEAFDLNVAMTGIYEKVKFSKEIEHVKQIVEKINVDANTVAIHVRGGDIVYGPFRFSQRFQNKVLPLPLAKEFARLNAKQGVTTVVFVQDDLIKAVFRDLPNVIVSSDLTGQHEFTTLQQAFFDILLMSRCQKIIAGSSGFAEVAATISAKSIVNAKEIFSNRQILSILKSDLEVEPDYDDLQLAFCWFVYSMYGENVLSSSEIDAALKKAQYFDSKNQLYALKRAINFLAHDQLEKAEQVLHMLFEHQFNKSRPFKSDFFVALSTGRSGMFSMHKYFKYFRECKKASRPYTQVCKAYIYYISGNKEACHLVLDKLRSYAEYSGVLETSIVQLEKLSSVSRKVKGKQ